MCSTWHIHGTCAGAPLCVSCKISLECVLDCADLSPALQARFQLFRSLFAAVDGSSMSQKDRMALGSGGVDEPCFTYGEIGNAATHGGTSCSYIYSYCADSPCLAEFPSFVRLLEDVGAREGQVFADLGSGAGKAVVAAALSGIKFLRCIGE